MARKTELSITLHIEGVGETLRAFSKLDKDASKKLREGTLKLSEALARSVRRGAVAEGSQAALMAPTVKAVRDRVPAIQAGGARRVGRHRAPAWALLFASEFGMERHSGWYAMRRYHDSIGRQYRPHLGRGSYWFFRTVEHNEDRISEDWNRVADDLLREFGEGG